ncbi:MFS transporter [Natrarchaeobius chitinivorans]|uniref:MFS transporter n=1 Tax=Natrarchaeobius chitinivorans TaxID=1679083 RepID=A0A3N6PEU6_NATCH|nr:MFS transporter [Natrarchaeobius chitinivorans]RQG95915.1 MFS transporter [Natrarchaeobius chitinivorans]
MDPLSRVRNSVEPLWTDGRGWILFFVSVGWLLTLGTRYAFPALFPQIQTALELDLSTLGALYTLLWATYALGQFPAGYVSDLIGIRRTLGYSTFLSAVALLVIGFVSSLELLAIGMFLFGVTSALYGPSRITIATRIYDDRAGTAIGLTQASGQIGNMTLPALSGFVATVFVWQAGFLYIIPLFVIAGVGIWVVVPSFDDVGDGVDEPAASTDSIREIVAATCFPLSLVLTAILALSMFLIQGVTGFYTVYLVEVKGLAPTTAATVFAFLFAVATAVQPLAGALKDQIGTRSALFIVVGVLSVTLPLVTVATTFPQIVFVTVLLGSMFGASPIALTRLTNALPSEIRGSGLGLLRTGYFLFASAGSFVVGTLADRGLFDESFFLLTILAVVVLVLALFLDRLSR